jgi:DNA polymerase-3 subunit alpha
MEQMGFPTYFLVVWDYIRFARENGIPVGPGRGSAAGSLVAYALGITNIDPVTNGLLFERFLNPERKSMPDIDTDFCIERRGEVIDYVTRRYGEDKVAQIITFNRMTSKAVLKDVARVLDIPYGEADRLAKLIPVVRGKPAKLDKMIGPDSPVPEFREKYEADPKVKHWVDLAMRIEGTNKTFGVHAAGVVIAADPLDELVPLQRNNDGQVITQYFMEDVESMGLLKMDFLGLKNLTMIQKTLDLVEQSCEGRS